VCIRDRGRCAFVSAGGRRCGERGFVEFHHAVVPYAAGGRATVENIELRCHAHNDYEADVFYGPCKRDGGAEALRQREAAYGRVIDDAFRSGTTSPRLASTVLSP
jgi:hypothetical protein